jgi:PAS domain S-box-containing protein
VQVSAPWVAPGDLLWALAGVLVDDSLHVVAANPAACAVVGLAEHELVGRESAEIVVPREVADFRHELRAGLRGDAPTTYEHELRTSVGNDRRVIAWSISCLAASPAEIGCVGVDVTVARNDSDVLRLFTHTLRSQGLTIISVPWTQDILVLLTAAIVGVLAAWWPAARAARTKPLDAITEA